MNHFFTGSANIHSASIIGSALLVTFHDRKGSVTSTYQYPAAAPHFEAMVQCEATGQSVGQYFHQNVRSLPAVKVS